MELCMLDYGEKHEIVTHRAKAANSARYEQNSAIAGGVVVVK